MFCVCVFGGGGGGHKVGWRKRVRSKVGCAGRINLAPPTPLSTRAQHPKKGGGTETLLLCHLLTRSAGCFVEERECVKGGGVVAGTRKRRAHA
jgi:hypothetical protein